MTRRFGKKRSIALGALFLLLLTAGAVAYFTASGAGSGSATVGTASAITLTGTTSGSLYPGTNVPVTLKASNPGTGTEYVTSVTLSGIKACYNAAGTSQWVPGTGCSNSGSEVTTCEDYSTAASNPNNTDFWMPPVTEGVQLAGNSSNVALTSGTLTMSNLNSSQNQCAGANLYLSFTSS